MKYNNILININFMSKCMQRVSTEKIFDEKNSKSFAFNPHSNLVTLNF